MATKHLTARPLEWIWQQAEWPNFTWDESALSARLAAARRAQGELTGMAKLLDPQLDLAAQLEVLTIEGLSTSAIEGETFDPNMLRSSIARHLGLPTAGLPARTRSVDGLVEVLLDASARYSEPLTLERLCAWQGALFPSGRSGLHAIRTGKLRGAAPMRIVSGPVGRERVHYEAPPHTRLSGEMRRFLKWFNAPPGGLDGLLRAALAHGWFELLHPFEDGNGRVGRAVADMALAQDEGRSVRLYSLSQTLMANRDEYYAQLELLSKDGLDVTPWLAWFTAQVEAAARASEDTFGHVLQKARFWVLHAHTTLNERQRKALNRMLDAGPGGFEGGMTNRKYASLTKSSTATAQRDLAELVAKQCLALAGGGRSARYELVIV
ncbi:MAG: Fic family protein [Burkholderiales bacterium]